MKTQDKFATQKKKYSSGNNMPFKNKSLSRVKSAKFKNALNRRNYAKQHMYCVLFREKPKAIIMQT